MHLSMASFWQDKNYIITTVADSQTIHCFGETLRLGLVPEWFPKGAFPPFLFAWCGFERS